MAKRKDAVVRAIDVTAVKQSWDSLLAAVTKYGTRVVVEEGGVPVAGIVSAEDMALLRRLDAEHSRRFDALERIRAPFRSVAPEEIEAEVRRAIDEVRAEDRELPRHRSA